MCLFFLLNEYISFRVITSPSSSTHSSLTHFNTHPINLPLKRHTQQLVARRRRYSGVCARRGPREDPLGGVTAPWDWLYLREGRSHAFITSLPRPHTAPDIVLGRSLFIRGGSLVQSHYAALTNFYFHHSPLFFFPHGRDFPLLVHKAP